MSGTHSTHAHAIPASICNTNADIVALLPAERAQYSAIIDDILAKGDLQTITAKQIRKALAEKLDSDIGDKKVSSFWVVGVERRVGGGSLGLE